ncbi:MAG: transcriptional regulator NrdR [Deltaproteobacteria bacterium]|jgi:transcriptional repressor NrdR|nr:transcriptional regulator NrdR [Deltaproteobacteria bacterium]
MKCLFCGELENKVIDSRLTRDSLSIRRRRECLICGRRFTTFEKVEEQIPMLVKKDGRREIYNREKLRKSLVVACQKRSVSVVEIDAFIDQFERQFQEGNYREIHTSEVGERVVEFLRLTDPVAYVRFASVYRQFKSLEDFNRELKELNVTVDQNGPPPNTHIN